MLNDGQFFSDCASIQNLIAVSWLRRLCNLFTLFACFNLSNSLAWFNRRPCAEALWASYGALGGDSGLRLLLVNVDRFSVVGLTILSLSVALG